MAKITNTELAPTQYKRVAYAIFPHQEIECDGDVCRRKTLGQSELTMFNHLENWHQIDFKGKIGIVIGSEGKGIRTLVRKSCDFMCTIPMQGKINSLNITAALSAILFERQRQIETK